MDEITATFQDLRNLHENIVILDKSSNFSFEFELLISSPNILEHEYENFVFIGTTLWTEYPCNSNDTVKIYVSQNKTLTHDVYLNRFHSFFVLSYLHSYFHLKTYLDLK